MTKREIFTYILAGCILGCQAQKPQGPDIVRYRQTRLSLGTIVNLDICATPQQKERVGQAYQKAWQKVEDINARMNVFNKDSEVARINGAYLKPLTVSDDMYRLVAKSIEYSRLSHGAFDIAILPLIYLWQGAQRTNSFPSIEQIQEIKRSAGYDKLHLLDDNQVVLSHPKAAIDLGAIAKGYAIDAVAGIFREQGLHNFFIDAGGDIFTGGHNCEDRAWRVGIKHPRYKNKILEVVPLQDQAITTSGDYERFYYINDQRWSHIINPITGYPQKGVVSATVIAPDATVADALATALCVLPPQQGLDLIDSLGDDFASVIQEEGKDRKLIIHKSRAYKKIYNK